MELVKVSEDGTKLLKRVSKNVAKITICGAVSVVIDDTMQWTRPTEEQIKNLKDMFCIDVELFD